ncbi:MAG TPA: transposase, partial [Bacteroidia bacterium]|nr:transposase [Bacteroidia bacterium]
MDSTSLISMFLPDGILDYYEITNVLKSEEGFRIYLSEKNSPPAEFAPAKLTSKGFFDEITVQDFP